MYGIDLPGLVRLLAQLGVIVVGASSLWGYVFMLKHQRSKAGSRWFELASIVYWVGAVAMLVYFVGRVLVSLVFSGHAMAHEGIVIPVSESDYIRGLEFTLPATVLLFIIGILFYKIKQNKEAFLANAKYFFLAQFLLVSFILSFIVYTGELSVEQLFHSFHNWHSVITLGTVITIDVLYISTLKKDALKRLLFPFFPIMSAAIWVGLGLDFLSVTLIFPDAIMVTEKFLFNQTVIAIIIINGALLSGKVNKMLISLVEGIKVKSIPKEWKTIFEVSGSVSIVSWLTITSLDFFELEFSYFQFMGLYLAAIATAYLTQKHMESAMLKK